MDLLSDDAVEKILQEAVKDIHADNVLVVIPDATRTAPVPLFFRLLSELLQDRVEELVFLIALGTHPLMSEDAIDKLMGMEKSEREKRYPKSRVVNHRWDLEDTFVEVGRLTDEETFELSGGRLSLSVPIRINRLLLWADQTILLGPVFPHEVAGFSGGHKYLFPGVGGSDVIHFTHWLGALVTSYSTIGRTDTAVRRAIELAATRVPGEKLGLCLVTSKQGLHGIFHGPVPKAWKEATQLSSQIHIKWCEKPYKRILSIIPERYDDVWTGAKGMYKVEPVLEDGGEVVLLAPHISEFSYTHKKVLDQVGYHIRDYFVKQWDKFKDFPWGVLAHSTHLRGGGVFEDGVEKPRIKVTLASQISPERCQAMNLGYLDPSTINPAEWEGREDEGVLLVPNAGETLYRLVDQK